jgi:hypothetical protein
MIAKLVEPLKKLSFLIGEWKGRGEGFDTSKDTEITNTLGFTYDPSPSIITGRFEARRAGIRENSGMMIFLYDPNVGKIVRKQVYSYGFIMNEVGDEKDDRFVFDCVSIDAEPDYWKGLKIRSFLQKHSDKEISMGLEVAKRGEDFRVYGQNRFHKIK